MSKPGLPRLEARLRSNITGDVFFDQFSRGRYATDASQYQMMPRLKPSLGGVGLTSSATKRS